MEESPVKVAKLIQSTKVPDRWYVELESGESLRVNVALIADYSLYPGRELSAEELDSLRQVAGIAGTRARAMRIIGSRQISKKDLQERLVQKGESEDNAESTVNYLEKLGILNDAEYASAITRHYTALGYGLSRIKNELYRRGVPRELWDEALQHLPEPDDTLDSLIRSRLRGSEPDDKERKKLTDYLVRRGFGWEDIKCALSRYTTDTDTENEE